MVIAVGLGNPGDAYRGTRHNIGKETVALLAETGALRVRPGRGEYLYAEDGAHDLVVVVPTTFVNTGGVAVRQALDQFRASTEDLLVVCDDFWLPLGAIRIRSRGGDGGHNGLASVIFTLGSQEFKRLRIGIGNPPPGTDPADFVLSRFGPNEEEAVDRARRAACGAIVAISTQGVARAMNLYNKRRETGKVEQ